MGLWAVALVVIAIKWPQHLVQAAIVCSVFEGAAIVNAGGLGVSPYYFTLMLVAVHAVLLRVEASTLLGFTPGVRRVLSCALVLLTIGLGSAVVMPRVFAGWAVLSPRLSADAKAPLSFSTSNIGQAVYLLLNIVMLWYTAQTCRTPAAARGMMKAFLIAGIIVVGLAAYQFVSSTLGLPFPDDLLYSNDAYVMQHGTAILDLPRICSTFTEPAALAVFLIGFIAFLITWLETAAVGWRGTVLLLASIVALIFSTSSTAYLGLALIACWGIWKYMLLPLIKGRGNVKAAVALAVLLGAGATTFVLSEQLQDVVQKTVFEKDESASYEERSQADGYSMHLAAGTWGLGVGLGSNRASSFFPSVISTLGVCGGGALATLLVLLVRSPVSDTTMLQAHRPLAAALVGIVVAKLISSPDLATPSMWAAMGALISVRAAAESSESVWVSYQSMFAPHADRFHIATVATHEGAM